MSAEFQRQVDNLVSKGYPGLSGLGEERFRGRLAPLEELATGSFALVVPVPRHEAVPLLELAGRPGFTDMETGDLERFAPIEEVDPPAGPYLLADPDTGRSTLNVTPDDALPKIVAEGRSPLTLDEGLALVTHFPERLREQNCFSMLGSRCGDRRVTALWISGRRPRLGWCWAGNPHTWLGSASCRVRVPNPS